MAVDPSLCFKCKLKPMEYETDPCHHHSFCEKCAMQMATGGRCRVCGNLFSQLRRIHAR